MTITTEQRIKNEKHFLMYMKAKTKSYTWIDTANIYDMSSGRKIVPTTLKGFVELSGIVRREFAVLFIDLPEVISPVEGLLFVSADFDKNKLLDTIYSL